MGMDQKEAMKLIGNKSMTPDQKIEQYYDFTKLKPGVQQDLVSAVTLTWELASLPERR